MPIELLIYIIGAVVAGWTTARLMWDDDYRWLMVPLVMIWWPLVIAGGIVIGIGWLFIKSAEPGVIRLPKWRPNWNRILFWDRAEKRNELEQYIAELEAELEIQQTVVGELGELPERPFIWIKTPTQN